MREGLPKSEAFAMFARRLRRWSVGSLIMAVGIWLLGGPTGYAGGLITGFALASLLAWEQAYAFGYSRRRPTPSQAVKE